MLRHITIELRYPEELWKREDTEGLISTLVLGKARGRMTSIPTTQNLLSIILFAWQKLEFFPELRRMECTNGCWQSNSTR